MYEEQVGAMKARDEAEQSAGMAVEHRGMREIDFDGEVE